MDEKEKKTPHKEENDKLSEFWPEEAVQEILDYIEEQGVYIRE
ncbi:MAG: hypothetical protein PUF72_01445 [Clostridiales bacterium]|nr:hypothetical protein [Clostridiales bacterium]